MKRKIEATEPPQVEIQVGAGELILAYKRVFGSQDGRIVLADLMRHFGFTMQSTFSENHATMARNEGSRGVLIHIGRRLEADPASVEATEKTEIS